MLLEIRKWPDPVLRQKTVAVSVFDEELETFSRNMIETMRAASGIGLSANQVGDLRRVAVVEVPFIAGDKLNPYHGVPIVLVNPRIIESSSSVLSNEGCLSLPDTYDTVRRHKVIKIEYQNLSGEIKTMEAENLMSMCLQHEIDHLDGKTLMERASRIKKDIMVRRLKKTGNL
jgi:peptide deformylase